MRVKICGLTRPEDVRAAVEGGADALGFVVGSPASPRNLTLGQAKHLTRCMPAFAFKVAVTSSQDFQTVRKICSELSPHSVQLHRHNQEFVSQIRKTNPEVTLILAAAIEDRPSVLKAEEISKHSDALLADSPDSRGMGGTGRTHNWKLTASLRRKIAPRPLILAGGLTPSNVRAAIRTVRPYAVDVSSGVERMPGIKDHEKVRGFIMRAKEQTA